MTDAWKYLHRRGELKKEEGKRREKKERKKRKSGVIVGAWIDDLLASGTLRYAADTSLHIRVT